MNINVLVYLMLLVFPCITLANNANKNLETMVVTASRTPVPENQVGSSLTIITAEQLLNQQVVPVSEILRNVPGLSVNRAGSLGSITQIRIRGAEANQVMVIIDGIEANDVAQGGEFDFAHLLSSEIERIEIVRGPQSALWGSDALAGVINIITKRGKGELNIMGFLEGGSFGTKYGGGNLSGSGNNYQFNFNGSYVNTGGENISRNNDEDDGYKNATLSFIGSYMLLEKFLFDLSYRHTDVTSEFDNTDFIITGLPADTDSETQSSQDYFKLQSSFSFFDNRWRNSLKFAVTSTENDTSTDNIETLSTQSKKYKIDYLTSVSFETNTILNVSHTATFAVDYEKEEYTQRAPITFFGNPNQELDVKSTGVVAEYRVDFADQIYLSAGVRHDNNSDFKDTTTYRATAAYNFLNNNTRLRASYGTGVKNPSFTDRFGFFANSFPPFVGNSDLKPESSSGWEFGFEQFFLEGQAQLGITYFKERLVDEIDGFAFDPVRFVFTAQNVNGRSNREGLEFASNLMVDNNLKISAGYTYVDATQPDASGRQIQEVRRPTHIAHFNVDYVFLQDRANVNLNIYYNSTQEDDFFAPFPNPVQRVELDSYTLINLAAAYKLTDKLSLYGRIENLLNDNYEEVFGFQTPGIGGFVGIRASFSP